MSWYECCFNIWTRPRCSHSRSISHTYASHGLWWQMLENSTLKIRPDRPTRWACTCHIKREEGSCRCLERNGNWKRQTHKVLHIWCSMCSCLEGNFHSMFVIKSFINEYVVAQHVSKISTTKTSIILNPKFFKVLSMTLVLCPYRQEWWLLNYIRAPTYACSFRWIREAGSDHHLVKTSPAMPLYLPRCHARWKIYSKSLFIKQFKGFKKPKMWSPMNISNYTQRLSSTLRISFSPLWENWLS